MIRLHHYYLMSWLKASATTRICCIVLQTTSCQGFRFSYFSSRNFVMSWHNYYYSSTVVVPLLGPALPVLGQCQAVPLHPGPGLLRKVKVCMLCWVPGMPATTFPYRPDQSQCWVSQLVVVFQTLHTKHESHHVTRVTVKTDEKCDSSCR